MNPHHTIPPQVTIRPDNPETERATELARSLTTAVLAHHDGDNVAPVNCLLAEAATWVDAGGDDRAKRFCTLLLCQAATSALSVRQWANATERTPAETLEQFFVALAALGVAY